MTGFREFIKTLRSLFNDSTAASTIEYAMILGFIVLLMFIALTGLATEVTQLWNDISTKAANAAGQ
ncbi:Flp family type IVb pilin [Novosphingobium colocasiae]|uniref:Flp family type IVb pilin n=1 Tax=Novosphingobium colocasiae TaxID=1256513 RepID=A0A918UH64_9SPHN|nr:Flp family type IVb pilin [Novosphingobium colocasiae]GGZ08582.1 hypothetical protein GCM10011614_24330 [Novosphingobium colocasiae]